MLLRLSYLLAILLTTPLAYAETRVFVSLAGTLLEAEIVAVAGENVTLKRIGDGQPLTINRNTLCKEDVAYISRWEAATTAPGASPPAPVTPAGVAAPKPSGAPFQKYSLDVQTQPSRNNQAPAGSNESIYEVSYTFTISNKEVSRDLAGGKAVIYTLGRNVMKASDVLVLQKLELDLAVQAQDRATLTTPAIHLISSQDPRYGVRSMGYVLFVLDALGNVLKAESSPDGTSTDWQTLSALPYIPCLVDRDFQPRPGLEQLMFWVRF